MGYNNIYEGKVYLDKPLDDETYRLIMGIADTRRMKWDVKKLEQAGLAKTEEIGDDGEFYFDPRFEIGNELDGHFMAEFTIKGGRYPHPKQPSLYCPWTVSEDRMEIVWKGWEKAYKGHEWLVYLVKEILVPRGFRPKGIINWFTEDGPDSEKKNHTIVNGASVKKRRGYSPKQKEPDVEAWYKQYYDWY